MSVDQRVHPRAPLELRVVYQRLNAFIADYTHNLSKGGTFIKTPQPAELGVMLEFQLHVPGREEPFRLAGKVVWVTSPSEASPGAPAGMGLQFLWEDDEQQVRFEEAVQGVIDDALGPELAKKLTEREAEE